ncbi:hypothetical protein KY314_02010 [Candidatus Woesearchaeota archaeon]|nr:hypothetical protein [Candidatus Woesearchaeota archaeon]
MLDNKKLKLIEKKIPKLLSEKEIVKNEQNKKLTAFYSENALISLNTAKILNEISNNNFLKKQFDFIYDDFESYLWIVNTSYYSMFYMAGAMLAKKGIKIKSCMGIHKKTFETMVYYFYLTKKIAKNFLEEFEEAQKESQELLGTDMNSMQEKARELMIKYNFEMEKRAKFTYNLGTKSKQNKAATSLKRAVEFYNECLRIMDKI